ncbi:unnamed protein product [Schistosoma curassoni]|uniref:Integrase n=1 Tax=Schistosoma curassoni TaxID=6186 RepID=A0A183KPP8_9TREM|nr:unnamed protein product [Schistosoma curassoni]
MGLNKHKRKARSSNTTRKEPTRPHMMEKLWNRWRLTYLGNIIDEQGGSDADLKARIGKARTSLLQLKNI